jgi:hypothetical protein
MSRYSERAEYKQIMDLAISNWRKRNPEKYIARNAANRYRYIHHIDRGSCMCGCGKPAIDSHHEDYAKPLVVAFLTRKCHKAVHKGIIPCPAPVNLEAL